MRADAAYESFRTRRMFGNLDGLRAISILVVLWHHTVVGFPAIPGTQLGFLGVDVFFVISGFLIVTLLLRERDRNTEISLKRFYMRRTLRIFPLYYLVVLLTGVLCVVREGRVFNEHDFFDALPYYLTYTSNWYTGGHELPLAVAWSLAAEEQFYLLWPPIERFAKKAAIPLLLVALAYNQAINFQLVPMPFGLPRLRLPVLQATFTPILLGVGLAHLLHHRAGFARVFALVGHRYAAIGLLLLTAVAGNLPNGDISGIHRLSLQLLFTFLLASLVVREDSPATGLLRHRVIVRCGQISYGLYLWHMLVRAFASAVLVKAGLHPDPGTRDALVLYVTVLAGTWVVAELSHRFFESPILRLKARYAV